MTERSLYLCIINSIIGLKIRAPAGAQHITKAVASVWYLLNHLPAIIRIGVYTKLDPTLPRVSNIPCPNAACISNRPDEDKSEDTPPHEVIYLRYNDAALKFVYICNQCDTIWKSAESK